MALATVNKEDLLRSAFPRFGRLERDAITVIRQAAAVAGPIGVSFSGGKDSTVLLHLVRRALHDDVPAALFDSGCEMQATIDLAHHYGAELIPARMSFQEMARYAGWWGYPHPVDPECGFDLRTVLIDEPAETFTVRHRLRCCAIGLRAEESKGRQLYAATRGKLYQRADRTWSLCPLLHWQTADIWAYIALHGLRYHTCYDAMSTLKIPRQDQRLGASLGAISVERGRLVLLRRIDPLLFNRLAAEFPDLRNLA